MHCLQGIAARDASRVAAGIDEHLNGFYKAFCIDPMEKILSLDAHAMFRLAERIDPKLVRCVDTERDAPWDHRPFRAKAHAGAISKRVANLARAAGVKLTMKSLRRVFGCYHAVRVSAQVLQ